DDHLVIVETYSALLTITQPREVGLYIKAFDGLAESAIYGQEARGILTRTLPGLDPPPQPDATSRNIVAISIIIALPSAEEATPATETPPSDEPRPNASRNVMGGLETRLRQP